MTAQETQGAPRSSICARSRAGFYRFGEARAPKRTEADLRDKIQKIALENRFYGYRRVCRDLWRIHGLKVNHKHVLRLMREDVSQPGSIRSGSPTLLMSGWPRSSSTWPSFSTLFRAG